MKIDPTAVISPNASIEEGVEIGPYSVIGNDVHIGKDTKIGPHVVIEGTTIIGKGNKIYQFASIGTPPQDLTYQGEKTKVIIGDNNVIREFVTINRASTKEDGVTVVGNNNYLMAYVHIAHDCRLGDNIIMANSATLGGHVRVGDHAIISAFVAVHQFVRIGEYSFVGAKCGVDRDIPPFMLASVDETGPRAKLFGVNSIGLRRKGFSKETIEALKKAYMIIWRKHKNMSKGIAQVEAELPKLPELELLLSFLKSSKRGIIR
jgi:UDP-N-acetylglucosamine acyltransferase